MALGSFWTTRGRVAGDGCEAVGAVQAARPVNGDTLRTSVSEGKAGEKETLGITQDGAGAQEYNLSMLARAPLDTRTANFGQGRGINASFMMIQPGFPRWNAHVGFLTFLAVDAVCGGSRELSITFFSY